MNTATAFPYLLAVVFMPFVLACVAPLMVRRMGRSACCIFSAFSLVSFGYLVSRASLIFSGEVVEQGPFFLDGLSLLFSLIVLGIGAFVILYAGYYQRSVKTLGTFFFYFLSFLGAMLGIVLARDLITLFVFWEITTITSFLLIGFEYEDEQTRSAALQSLFTTSAAGLVLLGGILMLGQTTGSYAFTEIQSAAKTLRDHRLCSTIIVTIVIGAFAKSAIFPFHYWLPLAMKAPTPVSAFLHSATMVKAGVFLLARLDPTMGPHPLWITLLTYGGLITLLVAAVLSLRQRDMKLILAYLTILALGLITLLIGKDDARAFAAAMSYLLAHSLYKAALFMVAGILDQQTGTRDVTLLSGLSREMKATTFAAVLAAGSLAGLPPFLGFIAKESAYEALLQDPLFLGVMVFAMSTLVATALLIAKAPFFGARKVCSPLPGETTPLLWIPPVVLAVAGIALSVQPGIFVSPLISSGTQDAITIKLKLWHGFSWVLLLSLVSILIGVLLYHYRDQVNKRLFGFVPVFSRVAGPSVGYERLIRLLNLAARAQTKFLQSGALGSYFQWILGFALAITSYVILHKWNVAWPVGWTSIRYYEWILATLVAMGAITATLSQTPLVAITALGATGYGISLIFVLFGAPDLAMTQFLVETLTIILVALIFARLPNRMPIRGGRIPTVVNLALSLLLGTMLVLMFWGTLDLPFNPYMDEYFSRYAVPLAHGRNIVNVILVDFRALDTLGEITVIALTAIGIVGLLRFNPRAARPSK